MKCKFCKAELELRNPVCPGCGQENVKEPVKLWVIAVAVVTVLAIGAGIAAVAYNGYINGGASLVAENINAKFSYAGTEEQLRKANDVVVAKAGPQELTNGELQVIYWSMVYDFVEYYGDYAYQFIDFSISLDAQYYNAELGLTWQDYFMNLALETWYRYEVLCMKARELGVQLGDTAKTELKNLKKNMTDAAQAYNLRNLEALVEGDFGYGADFEDYYQYMSIFYQGNEFINSYYLSVEVSEADLEAYYEENKEELTAAGYSKEAGSSVSVRHVLIQPSDDPSVKEYTQAQWDACLRTAQDLLDGWKQGEATNESFAQLARDHSADGNAATGGLYTGITSKTNFVKPFLDWCMDPARQSGDTGLVQTDYGYHIMYFVEGGPMWRSVCDSSVRSEILAAMLQEWSEPYPLIVGYSRILLGEPSDG